MPAAGLGFEQRARLGCSEECYFRNRNRNPVRFIEEDQRRLRSSQIRIRRRRIQMGPMTQVRIQARQASKTTSEGTLRRHPVPVERLYEKFRADMGDWTSWPRAEARHRATYRSGRSGLPHGERHPRQG